MSGVVERKHGGTSEAPANERPATDMVLSKTLAKTSSTFEINKMQRGCVTCYMGPAGAVMGQTRFSVGTIQELYHAAHVASQYPDLLTERFPRVPSLNSRRTSQRPLRRWPAAGRDKDRRYRPRRMV